MAEVALKPTETIQFIQLLFRYIQQHLPAKAPIGKFVCKFMHQYLWKWHVQLKLHPLCLVKTPLISSGRWKRQCKKRYPVKKQPGWKRISIQSSPIPNSHLFHCHLAVSFAFLYRNSYLFLRLIAERGILMTLFKMMLKSSDPSYWQRRFCLKTRKNKR